MFYDIIFTFLFIIIPIVNCMYIACVKYDQNCSYQPCCDPYECYEQTVCIGMNNKTI
jgi:hypothetical protein